MAQTETDILIIGAGTGGCAAALAASSIGRRVAMTEPTDWVGGQLTSQAVPPDEHKWIERFGCTQRYRQYRDAVRDYYRAHYPLTHRARTDRYLNPGNGLVSALCHEPRVSVAVLEAMLATGRSLGLIDLRLNTRVVGATTDGDRVESVELLNTLTGRREQIRAAYVLDASELGDLLPLAGVEYVTGAESQAQTGEPHALAGDPEPQCMQAITWCFAMSHDPDADHTIDKPQQYDFWRTHVPQLDPPLPGPLLSWDQSHPTTEDPTKSLRMHLFPEDGAETTSHRGGDRYSRWLYRRILSAEHFPSELGVRDICLVNWSQNDYFLGSIIDQPDEEVERHLQASRELSRCVLYWLQTECSYPGLYLRPDAMGTEDGLAKAPYIRESRRIKAVTTLTENHVGVEARRMAGLPDHAEVFADSVGVGGYMIDLHARTGGLNGLNVPSYPFQIPMGTLLPERVENVLAAGKCLGATHISNGCTRLHPAEWNVGEAAGLLAAWCLEQDYTPRQVHSSPQLVQSFQMLLYAQGVEIEMDWATIGPIGW